MTLWVLQHPRVQASRAAQEKQASPFGNACFFVYVRELGLVTSKASLIKGRFGGIVYITLWVLQHPRIQASRAAQEKRRSR